MAAMAAAGALKGELIDKPKANKQRELAASTQQYSPWTGLKANPVQEADTLGNMISGAGAGAQMGMAMQGAQSDEGLKSAMTKYYDQGGQQGIANQRSLGLNSDYWQQRKQPAWSLLGSR